MLFNSLDFLIFFLSVFVVYWTIPSRARWTILLICSYFFYAYWNPLYVFLLFASTLIDYIFGLYFTSSNNSWKQRVGLIVSLSLNLGMLFSFKYYNFFADGINVLFTGLFNHKVVPNFSILLPVGISFYTFQSISYAIDVYKKQIPAERNLGKFALYLSFFPQLVAGPIERAKDLLPQINTANKTLSYDLFKSGLKYVLWGLFMKVVVADNLATLVDSKFELLSSRTGGEMLFAMILFTFQLYCDFNGYSRMAVGLAKLLGYDLLINFNYPFVSSSFTEFWRKWHISLSRWFRDYIYHPLGGSKKNLGITIRNTAIVFIVSGLWHGATINFLLWGVMCGVLMIIEILIKNYFLQHIYLPARLKFLGIPFVFSLFVLTLVPFRSNDLNDSLLIFEKIADCSFNELYFWFADNRFSPGLLGLYILIFIEIWFGLKLNSSWNIKNRISESAFYTVIFFMILLLGKDTGSQFIYFQF
jgi:alginate O-acetyltransferase complex protein AlgI